MIALVLGSIWALAVVLAVLDGRRPLVGVFAGLGLAGVAGCAGWLAWHVFTSGPVEVVAGGWPAGLGIRLRADALSVVFVVLADALLLVGFVAEAERGIGSRTFPALLAFLGVGLNGLFLTADAFNFYVFFEVAMAASFGLAAYGGEPRQLRAAYTFAVVNLVGSAFFLVAVAGLYRATGTLDLPDLAAAARTMDPTALLPMGALLFIALSLKLGLFPFHFWLPPVYRDTRPSVAALLSGVLANIGSYGLLRFAGDALPGVLDAAGPLVTSVGVVSILYGGVLALARPIVAEVLAYSSIGQAGYILVAVGIGGPAGYAAAIVYSVINSIGKMLLFLSGGLKGPVIGVAFGVGAFSVAGLPPSAGFFGKAALFRAAAVGGDWPAAAFMVMGSVLSLVYMARVYQRRFWSGEGGETDARPSPGLMVAGLAGILLGLGLWPQVLLWAGARAAAGLG